MNLAKKLILAGLVGGSLLAVGQPALAWNPSSHPTFRGGIRRDIHRDRIDLFRDRRDLRRDEFELRRDLRRGASPAEIARERRDIFEDRRDVFRDRRDLREDFGELRRDRRDFFWWRDR